MYKKSNTIISNKENLANYIEGYDIYNSTLLVILNDPSISRVQYEITAYEYRPDLLAKDFYGSTSYMGLLILQASRGLETYKRGSILNLIPKNILDNILSNI